MIAYLVAGVASVPFLTLIAEILAGLKPAQAIASSAPPSLVILIPAHDEGAGVAHAIAAIRAVAPDGARILVVADNCSDDTASQARFAGADVVERHDPERRGKGYALAFGRDVLAASPPETVVILDADCVPHHDTFAQISAAAMSTGRPVQAINLVDPPMQIDSMGRVSTFAFCVKNLVRQRGVQRIAGTCVLTGTGMAFPWALFRDAPLATADSVEDLALGLRFVMQGTPPQLCDGTLVTSPSPPPGAAAAQRTRWEHGFITTAVKVAPRMLGHGVRRLHWPSIWLGLHLMVPPLALLVMLGAVVLGGLALTKPAAALAFAAIYVAALLAVFAAWIGVGRQVLPPALLLKIPGYMLWKLPIYLRLARGADRRWTRTGRD
jgi:cellulose synthase/poly-beta-1,6-N-acetylglucosamine synthase-like glycosyltransferase